MQVWLARTSCPAPPPSVDFRQSSWDEAVIKQDIDFLCNLYKADRFHTARLLASQNVHSGDWLHALPISACGLRLDDEAIRIAIGLRLGTNLCQPHPCPCGNSVDARGTHGLACKRSAGRQPRHALLNDAINRALVKAGVPSVKEPAGLFRSDGKRPDGCTLVPWKNGKCLTWDVTGPDTLANSHLAATSSEAGAAAESASRLKTLKYSEILTTHDFVAIAVESLGPINRDGQGFIDSLGLRLSSATGDPRERSFLYQRLSIINQRCNAVSFAGSFLSYVAHEHTH
jgi:hypothetical protein